MGKGSWDVPTFFDEGRSLFFASSGLNIYDGILWGCHQTFFSVFFGGDSGHRDIAELIFVQYGEKTHAFLKGQKTQVGYQKRVLSQKSPLWFSGDHLGKVRISSGSSYEK